MTNKFKNQISENEKLIHQCEAKIHELKLGDVKEKIGRIALMGTLFYLPVLGVLFLLNIPGALLPIATLVGSFGLGACTNGILEKKAKCKKRFRKISKSKNESERLEEVLRLEMDIERLKSHNETLEKVITRISKEEDMHYKITRSGRYVLYDKRDKLSKEDLVKKISSLEEELETKLSELNALVDESTLRSKKDLNNDKLGNIFHSMIYSTVPGMLSVLTVMTYMVKPLPEPSLLPIVTALGTMGGTFAGSLLFLNKTKRDQEKAINRINEDRIQDDRINIDHQISSIKAKINNIYFALYDYKKKLKELELRESGTTVQTKVIEHTHEFDESLDDEYKLTLK